MQDTDQFARLLHIQRPWRVSLVEVDEKELTVAVHVRIDDEVELHCPECNARSPRYDRRRRTWRHLDTMEFSTFVTAEIPRVRCATHGIRQLPVPWAEDSSRYTVAFESHVIDWLRQEASINAVAEQMRLSWGAIDAIMKRAVKRGLERRELAPPVHLAIDETSFQKRHEYVTVVTDQQSGAVVHVADDRSIESIETYFAELTSEECARIESVSMDMWPAYITTVSRYVPNAEERICRTLGTDRGEVVDSFGWQPASPMVQARHVNCSEFRGTFETHCGVGDSCPANTEAGEHDRGSLGRTNLRHPLRRCSVLHG